jgi:hypothetical protein
VKKSTRLIRPRASKSQAAIDKIAALEARILALEARMDKFGVDRPEKWPDFTTPWFQKGLSDSCHVCGLKWSESMGYVCNHPSCPNRVTVTCNTLPQPGFTCSSTSANPIDDSNPPVSQKPVIQHFVADGGKWVKAGSS